jgi:hypothetical protein
LDIVNPVESVGGKIVLSPNGTLVLFLGSDKPVPIEHYASDAEIEIFRGNTKDLVEIAVDLDQPEAIAEEAIQILGVVGDERIAQTLRDIKHGSFPEGRRMAAQNASEKIGSR